MVFQNEMTCQLWMNALRIIHNNSKIDFRQVNMVDPKIENLVNIVGLVGKNLISSPISEKKGQSVAKYIFW